MKKLLLLTPLFLTALSGCDMAKRINQSTCDINRNTAAVERSTEAVNRNLEELETIKQGRG